MKLVCSLKVSLIVSAVVVKTLNVIKWVNVVWEKKVDASVLTTWIEHTGSLQYSFEVCKWAGVMQMHVALKGQVHGLKEKFSHFWYMY